MTSNLKEILNMQISDWWHLVVAAEFRSELQANICWHEKSCFLPKTTLPLGLAACISMEINFELVRSSADQEITSPLKFLFDVFQSGVKWRCTHFDC